MRLSSLGLLAGLTVSTMAEDLLFVDTFEFQEYAEATGTLGLTAKVVTETEWRGMTTADFAAFKAIVIADPNCSSDPAILGFLTDTKEVWGPAVKGNIVLIGTDPTFHFSAQPGAKTLIDNAVAFSAAGKTLAGKSQTGLYFALSCYYNSVASATVDSLSYFGEFTVRGNLDCYNNAHVVASSPALGTLDDAALSDWECSVHEAFSKYPTEGVNGFEALAIAKDIIGDGSKPFAGGIVGLPYIISRGATPDGCGDGKWEKDLGEECDDGNTKDGDGCSKSCKCESGLPKGDGTCLPKPEGNHTTTYAYSNKTVTATATVTATEHPSYVTPYLPPGPTIIGVEIIVYVSIIEDCKTYGGSTVTSYITSACSTKNRPIWDVSTSGYPCYVCEGIPTSSFITASTTTCLAPPPTYIPKPPVILPCHTCSAITLSTCPVYTPVSSPVYEVVAPTVRPYTHKQTETVAAVPTTYAAPAIPTTVAVKTYGAVTATASASPTYVAFTGAASRVGGAGVALGLIGGILGAAMLVL